MADPNVVGATGRPAAAPRPDHDWFRFHPLPARAPVRWPGGARVAVSVVLDLGAVEWERPGSEPVVSPPGGRGVAPYPDIPRVSNREFGHRVGVFRLLESLQRLGIAPAVVVDVLTAEHYPALVDHLRPAAGEILAGGLSASRPITSRMAADEERHYVRTTLERLEAALGDRPTGWLGPQHSESARTPGLLAAAGLDYVAEWANDEQPYPMRGAADGLWAYPLSWELSDLAAMHHRQVAPADHARALVEALERLWDEGAASGRALGIHLHPWLSGQPFRAAPIEQALQRIAARDGVWLATPAEIVDWCRRHAAGQPGADAADRSHEEPR